ncbi:hypothetical protein [Vulcanisaeta distributa]|uniref:hypothetical protein n=1 Tax=Vulcanisaeta distributa TaxID=164451 RepID=UPI0006D04D06|nr:hypothetical protein [Vulcanisaeta distributa]
MPTIAWILFFRDLSDRDDFINKLRSITEKYEYHKQMVRIPDVDGIRNPPISVPPLYIEVKSQALMQGGQEYLIVNFEAINSVPIINGEWPVKEKYTVYLYPYNNQELNDVLLAISDKSEALPKFEGVLKRLRVSSLPKVTISFKNPHEFIEEIQRLGKLNWIVIRDLPDVRLKGSIMWGEELEGSEVTKDLIKRGGVISAITLKNVKKDMQILISGRGGVIYTPQDVNPAQFAGGEVKDIILNLKKSNLLRRV